jgi:hypothetical protein
MFIDLIVSHSKHKVNKIQVIDVNVLSASIKGNYLGWISSKMNWGCIHGTMHTAKTLTIIYKKGDLTKNSGKKRNEEYSWIFFGKRQKTMTYSASHNAAA